MSSWQLLRTSLRASVDLHMVLCGGQCFRWLRTPRQTYVGVVQRRAYELREVDTSTQPPRPRVCVPRVIEYRRLYPPPTATAAAAQRQGQHEQLTARRTCNTLGKCSRRQRTATKTASSHTSDDDDDDDEAFLSHYLALDVNVPALWRAWTCDNAHAQHPLVQHLTTQPHSSNDTAERDDVHTTTTRKRRRSSARDAAATTTAVVADNKSDNKNNKDDNKKSSSSSSGSRTRASLVCPCIPVRHLRQDVHETLFSFVCSQNNHIRRITQMIASLCRVCGTRLCTVHLDSGDVRYDDDSASASAHARDGGGDANNGVDGGWLALYAFPTVTQLCGVDEAQLRTLGFGYRSAYIRRCALHIAAARTQRTATTTTTPASSSPSSSLPASVRVSLSRQHCLCAGEPWYEQLLCMSSALSPPPQQQQQQQQQQCDDLALLRGDVCVSQQQRAALMQLPGVGRKVADCVLLFALGHTDVVPVDTHMAQVAAAYLCDTHTHTSNTQTEKANDRRRNNSNSRSSSADWQDVLRAWRVRNDTLQATLQRDASDGASSRRRRHGARATTSRKTVAVAALSEAHHDAIQCGFRHLFGSHCGLAHTILFYHRAMGGAHSVQ